jgi:hypothetical protein
LINQTIAKEARRVSCLQMFPRVARRGHGSVADRSFPGASLVAVIEAAVLPRSRHEPQALDIDLDSFDEGAGLARIFTNRRPKPCLSVLCR